MAFDPLDGSSIIDTNFAVGTIFGVWPGSRLVGISGRELAGAGMAVYGPRTTMTVAGEALISTTADPQGIARPCWLSWSKPHPIVLFEDPLGLVSNHTFFRLFLSLQVDILYVTCS